MLKYILKMLWHRRYRNGWLMLELVVVFILSYLVFDPVIVQLDQLHRPMGFDSKQLCCVSLRSLQPGMPGYDAAQGDSLGIVSSFMNLYQRLKSHPDVQFATPCTNYSYPNSLGSYSIAFTMPADSTSSTKPLALLQFIPHTDYFQTLGVNGIHGISARDLDEMNFLPDTYVMTASTLRYFYGTDDPDSCNVIDRSTPSVSHSRIAAAVVDVKHKSFCRLSSLAFTPVRMFDPTSISTSGNLLIRLRPGVNPEQFIYDFQPWMSQNLHAGNLYASDVKTYDQLSQAATYFLEVSVIRRNLVIAIFFLVNLCLGVVGTFWLQTRNRREEIGVQLSFGCTRRRIMRQLLGEGAVMVTIASLIGAVLYFHYALSEGLSTSDYTTSEIINVEWPDIFWLHFGIVSLCIYVLLLIVVSIGVYIPARYISRIAPTDALHEE